jgi:type IV secretion system protein VirD4
MAALGSLIFLSASTAAVLAVVRRLRRPGAEPFGSARFASPSDVLQSGLTARRGIFIGRYQRRDLFLDGQRFVLVAAPTRSGKGVSVVIPNLLRFEGSAVVLDVKRENFALTAGWRAACGQRVFLFDPFAEDLRTHRYNPLDTLSPDARFRVGDVQAIAQILYPDNPRDRFWNEQARNLFLGLVLYLYETPGMPCTLGQVVREAGASERGLRATLEQRVRSQVDRPSPLSADCRGALARFLANGDSTFSGIVAALNAPLLAFANPIVDAATSASDFSLAEVRRMPTTIYIGVAPSRLADAARLINLMFAQLVLLNTRALPDVEAGETLQCLLLLDEFTALGPVPIIVDAMPYLAAYQLRLLTIVQSTSQLESVYGVAAARTFVTNHGLQVVFAPRDQRDAEDYSRALGTFTEAIESRASSISWTSASLTRSRFSTPHARALLLAQEVKMLGADKALVFLENTPPILVDRSRYFEDPTCRARLLPAPVVPQIELSR